MIQKTGAIEAEEGGQAENLPQRSCRICGTYPTVHSGFCKDCWDQAVQTVGSGSNALAAQTVAALNRLASKWRQKSPEPVST